MKKKPQAFPTHNNMECFDGMTLLDYFAGQALASMLDIPQNINQGTGSLVASLSYDIAEAMLEEREKRLESK